MKKRIIVLAIMMVLVVGTVFAMDSSVSFSLGYSYGTEVFSENYVPVISPETGFTSNVEQKAGADFNEFVFNMGYDHAFTDHILWSNRIGIGWGSVRPYIKIDGKDMSDDLPDDIKLDSNEGYLTSRADYVFHVANGKVDLRLGGGLQFAFRSIKDPDRSNGTQPTFKFEAAPVFGCGVDFKATESVAVSFDFDIDTSCNIKVIFGVKRYI